jgi:hypothetical protein
MRLQRLIPGTWLLIERAFLTNCLQHRILNKARNVDLVGTRTWICLTWRMKETITTGTSLIGCIELRPCVVMTIVVYYVTILLVHRSIIFIIHKIVSNRINI